MSEPGCVVVALPLKDVVDAMAYRPVAVAYLSAAVVVASAAPFRVFSYLIEPSHSVDSVNQLSLLGVLSSLVASMKKPSSPDVFWDLLLADVPVAT